jgi:hypothetical protein
MPGLASPLGVPSRRRRRTAPGSTVLPTPSVPSTPNTPSPANTAVAHYTLLSWLAAGQAKADIYLDTVTPPVALAGLHRVGFSFVPTLLPSTTYYWQIVAFNDGGSTAGPIWSFTTPAATAIIITLAGVDVTSHVRWPLCTIHDARNAAPNTASLTLDTAPTEGGALEIGLGSLDDDALLFSGELQAVDESYVDHPDSTLYPATGIDHTFTINKRRPFGTWTDVSATTIALAIATKYAPTVATTGIQAGLATVSITFDGSEDFMTCLGRLATAVSGYCDVDYSPGILLFLTDTREAPDPLDADHPPLNAPSPIQFATDLSQIRTRVYGKGHGEQLLTDVAVGQTILPIADASMFNEAGGEAVASTTPDGAQSEKLTYSGAQQGGAASMVGPGVFPSVGPTLTLAAGAGLGTGVYGYAYTDVTGSGESLPSPRATVTTGVETAAPTAVLVVTLQEPGTPGWMDVGDYDYKFTWVTATGETTPGPVSNTITVTADHTLTLVSGLIPPAWPSGVTALKVYRRFNSTGAWKYHSTKTNPALTAFGDGTKNVDLGADAPSTNTTAAYQVAISGVALGPTSAPAVTQRKVYRTAVQPTEAVALTAQLKLQQTIANNTVTVGVTDATADALLGANVPVADGSGLISEYGQVNAGSTSVIMTSPAPWSASGGWVRFVDGQLVRYTGLSGNTLIGIPASGVGALVNTVWYGDVAVVVPALTGVNANNGVAKALQAGASVHVWVERNDLAAQLALGLLELDADGQPTDGIREYLITDERRGEASLAALCDADLAQFATPIVSCRYYTRDPKTASGKTVAIDLRHPMFDPAVFDLTVFGGASFGLAGDFVIQSVDLTFDGPGLYPLRSVQASSVAFALSDLLQRVVLT